MRALLLFAVFAFLVGPAVASGCTPSTSQPTFCWDFVGVCASGDVAGTFYVNWDRCFQDECISLWIYQESNGIPGEQRRDEVVDDTCGGQIEGDTVVF